MWILLSQLVYRQAVTERSMWRIYFPFINRWFKFKANVLRNYVTIYFVSVFFFQNMSIEQLKNVCSAVESNTQLKALFMANTRLTDPVAKVNIIYALL